MIYQSFIRRAALIFTVFTLSTLTLSAQTATSIDFGYCGEPVSTSLVFNTGQRQRAAIYLPQNMTSRYAGAKITSVKVANGYIPKQRYATFNIMFTEDLFDEPFMTMSAVGQAQRPEPIWREYKLSTPYVIQEDKPFYVIADYQVVATDHNYQPIVTDMLTPEPNGYGDLIASQDDDGEFSWDNGGTQTGNVCIRLHIEGDNLPVNDLAVVSLTAPRSVTPNNAFNATVQLANRGANTLTGCVLRVDMQNSDPTDITLKFSKAIQYGQTVEMPLKLTAPAGGGSISLTATVLTVNNGEADTDDSNNSASASMVCLEPGKGFDRNFFVEEHSGTWCGYCPSGIVIIEQMIKQHGSRFIPVVVHSDEMAPRREYAPVLERFNGIAPAMFVARDFSQGPITLTAAVVTSMYESEIQIPAFVDVKLNVVPNGRTADLTATVTTAGDVSGSRYRLAYIVTEDGVGPYDQSNYYANNAKGPMSGWESKPSQVSTYFNDVARRLESYEGIVGSLPAEMKEGVSYTHKHTIELPEGTVDNPKNCNYVALVLNASNGRVENAVIVRAAEVSGVETIAPDTDAPVEYFDLRGMAVNPDNLQPGLYICRRGNSVSKIVVR